MSLLRTTIALSQTLTKCQTVSQHIQLTSRRFAGHSHWQNIRHIKADKDANKARQTDKHVRLIQVAVMAGGGPDPRLNKQLASAIEGAKRTQVVSNQAIDAAIKRALSGANMKNSKTLLYEFVGEHGIMVLANCDVPNTSKFIHTLKGVCKRHTFAMPKGGVKERFEEKGYVCVNGKGEDGAVDADEALVVALDGGAEDVTEVGEGNSKMLEFICAPQDYFNLLKVLQQGGYKISDAGTKYIPMMTISVEEDKLNKLSSFCDEMEEQPEVMGVYTNLA